MKETEFIIDPVAKPRMVRSDRWANRKVVNDYWVFKNKLLQLAKQGKFELPDKFEVLFYIKMPTSWSGKKRRL